MPASAPLGLRLIGTLKLTLGLLLLGLGVGVFRVRHADLGMVAEAWAVFLHFSVENRLVSRAIEAVSGIGHRKLLAIDALTFAYAGLYLAQGIGLLRRKIWAEYLVVVVTGLLVPYEIYEVLFHFGPVKLGILIVNLAILVYLLRLLKRQRAAA